MMKFRIYAHDTGWCLEKPNGVRYWRPRWVEVLWLLQDELEALQ